MNNQGLQAVFCYFLAVMQCKNTAYNCHRKHSLEAPIPKRRLTSFKFGSSKGSNVVLQTKLSFSLEWLPYCWVLHLLKWFLFFLMFCVSNIWKLFIILRQMYYQGGGVHQLKTRSILQDSTESSLFTVPRIPPNPLFQGFKKWLSGLGSQSLVQNKSHSRAKQRLN